MARSSRSQAAKAQPSLLQVGPVEEPEAEEGEEEEDPIVAPLFNMLNPPVYVDDLHPNPEVAIRWARFVGGRDTGAKKPFLPRSYKRTDGTAAPFEVRPAETYDADVMEVLEPGRYELQAIGASGRMITQRIMTVPDATERAADAAPHPAAAPPVAAPVHVPQLDIINEQMKALMAQNADLQKRLLASDEEKHEKTLVYAQEMAAQRPDTNALVATLREELTDARDEMKAMRRKHEAALDEERSAARKTLEEERSDLRKQLDAERNRHQREVEVERDRHRKEVDAMREDHRAALMKRDKDAAEERADYRAAMAKKEKDADDERRRLLEERDGVKKSLARESEEDRKRLLQEAKERVEELRAKNAQLEDDIRSLRNTYDKTTFEARKKELALETKLAQAGAKVDEDDDEGEKKSEFFQKGLETLFDAGSIYLKTVAANPAPSAQQPYAQPAQQVAQQQQQQPAQSEPRSNPASESRSSPAPEAAQSASASAAAETRSNPATAPAEAESAASTPTHANFNVVRSIAAQRVVAADGVASAEATDDEPDDESDEGDDDPDDGESAPAEMTAGARR